MPENVNTSVITYTTDARTTHEDQKESVISIDDVSMIFNMASETLTNLKEYAIALMRRELKFKEFRALNHISLDVKKGDVFGILGTNGSGKSTLLKIIAGVLEPSDGTCITKGSIAPLIELGAGFDMELTARENIYLNGALLGYSKEFITEHFDEIVDFAEISNFLDMPLKNYSSGMVARIAFAIATVTIPDILIVDEVLSVGDTMFQQKCEHRIQTLINDHQVSVLIVSHDTNQIERLCNKAAWIEKGNLRICGDAAEVCNIYRLVGGHIGSAEAEKTVLDLLFNKELSTDPNRIRTLSGETRYSIAVSLAYKNYSHPKTVILVPSEQESNAFLAQPLAARLDAPVLPTPIDMLPDVICQYITSTQPETMVLLGDEDFISRDIETELSVLAPNSLLKRLSSKIDTKLSLEIYTMLKEPFSINKNINITQTASSSKTAFLSYPECTGDLLSLSGYLYANQYPLFFSTPNTNLDEQLEHTLINDFSRIIVVGGQDIFPDEIIERIAQSDVDIVRIYGKNAYDANMIINEWLESENFFVNGLSSIVLAPCWRPENAFTIGAFTGINHLPLLLEDPENLDNVVMVIDYIKEHANEIETLIFVGNGSYYSQTDKNLLAKIL